MLLLPINKGPRLSLVRGLKGWTSRNYYSYSYSCSCYSSASASASSLPSVPIPLRRPQSQLVSVVSRFNSSRSPNMSTDATISQHPQQQPVLARHRAKKQKKEQEQQRHSEDDDDADMADSNTSEQKRQRPSMYFPLGYKEAASQWVSC